MVKQSPASEIKNSKVITEAEIVPPHLVHAFEDDTNGKDCRPRLTDGDVSYLLDSGSMCGVWPVSPDDKVDKNISLQTVDGSPFDCYGTKDLVIKINRKTYKYKVVIAKVKAPIIGWDFIRH